MFQPGRAACRDRSMQRRHGTVPCCTDPRKAPCITLTSAIPLCDVRSDAPWTPDSAGSTGGTPPPMMPSATTRGSRGPLSEFCVDLGDACPSLTVHGSGIIAETDGAHPAPDHGRCFADLVSHRIGIQAAFDGGNILEREFP